MKKCRSAVEGRSSDYREGSRLVVNLKSQENYIETGSRKNPLPEENTVQQGPAGRKAAECFSDCCKLLLSAGMSGGRRERIAEQYRLKANRTVRRRGGKSLYR